MSKYQLNTSYRPGVIKQAANLEKSREINRANAAVSYQTESQNYPERSDNYNYLSDGYYNNLPDKIKTTYDENLENINVQLDLLTPFTYDIPEEKRWASRARFVDKDGLAKPIVDDSLIGNQTLGRANVPDEYWDFMVKEMDREEAQQFKLFMFGQMESDNPVKKAYWKRNNPIYYQEMQNGIQEKLKRDFLEQTILLHSPQNEKQFNWLYMNNFPTGNMLYNQFLTEKNSENYPKSMPTVLPYPQGHINATKQKRVVNQTNKMKPQQIPNSINMGWSGKSQEIKRE